jgi:hypothetical protein
LAANDPASSPQVRTTANAMLQKFSDEFGTGVENTVATDYLTEGNRLRSKGIPKLVLFSMFLNPRTKSAIGVPIADRETIWQLLEEELINLALLLGPLNAAAGAPVAGPVAPHIGNNRRGGVAGRYTDDVNVFLADLDSADDGFNEVNDDDLQELMDAQGVDRNDVALDPQNWTRESAQVVVQLELDLYKATPGLKLCCPDTGKFCCALQWWRQHHCRFPYISKLALKVLAIPATSAPSERVFSTSGLP